MHVYFVVLLNARVGSLEKRARVSLILKVPNRKNTAAPFRPPSKAPPPKHVTSTLALEPGLPYERLQSCAMSTGAEC